MSDPSVAKIVYFGSCDSSFSVVSVDCGSDVSYQKRLAGLGHEKSFVCSFGSDFQISFECHFCRFIQRNCSFCSIFLGSNVKMTFFAVTCENVIDLQICQFSDSDSCLQ